MRAIRSWCATVRARAFNDDCTLVSIGYVGMDLSISRAAPIPSCNRNASMTLVTSPHFIRRGDRHMSVRTFRNAVVAALLAGFVVFPSSTLAQSVRPPSVLPSGGGQALLDPSDTVIL